MRDPLSTEVEIFNLTSSLTCRMVPEPVAHVDPLVAAAYSLAEDRDIATIRRPM